MLVTQYDDPWKGLSSAFPSLADHALTPASEEHGCLKSPVLNASNDSKQNSKSYSRSKNKNDISKSNSGNDSKSNNSSTL